MTESPSPVARIVEAARRIIDAVTPGEQDRSSDGRAGPIPATAPPSLRQAGDTAKRVATTAARTARRAAGRTAEPQPAEAPAREADPDVADEGWTKAQLYERAKELDVPGRSTMNKDELIAAIRQHR